MSHEFPTKIKNDQYEIDFEDEIIQEKIPSDEQDTENRRSFLDRFKNCPYETKETINFAYDLAKEAHRTQKRQTGERYFEHLRSAALILIDECKINDPNIISAALLHDSIEDSPIFGNKNKSYEEWKIQSNFRISKIFNEKVAKMVLTLTKPEINETDFKNKEEAHHFYIDNLKKSNPNTVLVKMADRLHNLRTLKDVPVEKQIKQIKETREIYLPIFENIRESYPDEVDYFIRQMNQTMAELENAYPTSQSINFIATPHPPGYARLAEAMAKRVEGFAKASTPSPKTGEGRFIITKHPPLHCKWREIARLGVARGVRKIKKSRIL